MAEQKYINFLNKLIMQTKTKKIKWKYLDSNKQLYDGMNWAKPSFDLNLFGTSKEKDIFDFNKEDSFYAKEQNIYIVIYVSINEPAKLYVIPETFKKTVVLFPEDYGEQITRLLNLVQSQFPNAESFIDDFINDNNQ